jgi:hypothetical protein
LVIPDTQVKPGVPQDHLDWVGQAIVHYKPDTVVHIGDHWDFPSLSLHEKEGSKALEGARYEDDVFVGNEAFKRINAPMAAEMKRTRGFKTPWKPRRVFLEGNHENRADRFSSVHAKLSGVVSAADCDTLDWERHGFLERVWIDGIVYAHYFQSSHSHRPIGGEVSNRFNRIGASFVQGHEQGFRYGNRITGSGRTWQGLVAGSCYTHIEDYRGAQGQQHWRGIVVLNEVEDGDYQIMPLTLNYLCWKYEGMPLVNYMRKKYPRQNWEHLA